MDKKKIKRLIAREGLILLGLAAALYLILMVLPNISFSFPKYRLEFDNGKSYIVTISPELSQRYNTKKFIDSALDPSAQLISKRVNEFIKDNNIKAKLTSSRLINSRAVYFAKLVKSFFTLNFIFKLIIIYVLLLIIRFILWALGILRGK
jgi:hypothetical protein